MNPFDGLKCILCSESDCITMDLDGLDNPTFRCRECEGDFTAEDVDNHVKTWKSVLGWVALAPKATAPASLPIANGRHV